MCSPRERKPVYRLPKPPIRSHINVANGFFLWVSELALRPECLSLCMRKAYYGFNAAIILAFHSGVALLHLAGIVPYFHTVFYPLFCLFAILLAVVGWKEKDKLKWPGLLVSVLGLAMLIHWAVMLVLRIQGKA